MNSIPMDDIFLHTNNLIDDWYQKHATDYRQGQPGKKPEFSDSELITVIVVDDCSSDSTARIAEWAGATVVRHTRNRGKGEALNTGMCAAAELFPDAVVVIDGDGQHLPEQLTALASQVPVSDSQSGFQAFSPRLIQADLFHCADFSVESEMQFIAHEHDLRVCEVPVTIRYSDQPKRSPWQQGLVVLVGILRLTGQYRPLFFFGLPGAVLMALSFAMGVYVVEIFSCTQELAVGHTMVSILLSVVDMALSPTRS